MTPQTVTEGSLDESPTTISLKLGTLEISASGRERFLRKELTAWIAELAKVVETFKPVHTPQSRAAEASTYQAIPTDGAPQSEISTNTIAARIGAASGPDLILAACAHLALIRQKEAMTRVEILEEMQNAAHYFKRSYSNNLTSYLKRLVVTGRLNERAAGSYTLSAQTRKEIESQLAEM